MEFNPFNTSGELPWAVAQSRGVERLPKSVVRAQMGARLAIMRRCLRLTQAALGDVMGVSESAIANYEGGTRSIDLEGLSYAAQLLGFSIDYIARGDVGSLRFDLAIRVQAAERAFLSEGPRRRGRPRAVKEGSAGGNSQAPEEKGRSAGPVTPICDDEAPLERRHRGTPHTV